MLSSKKTRLFTSALQNKRFWFMVRDYKIRKDHGHNGQEQQPQRVITDSLKLAWEFEAFTALKFSGKLNKDLTTISHTNDKQFVPHNLSYSYYSQEFLFFIGFFFL